MERQNVNSSMIKSIGYDSDNQILEIEFVSDGSVWQYYDFPEYLWYEFESSGSKGKFFHREVKGQYSESRVG